MLSLVLGFVTGLVGPISNVLGRLADLKIAQVQASTDKEKMLVDQQIIEAEGRKAVLIAEAGHRIAGTINASVRLFLTLGPAILLAKIFIWDKVVGSFAGCAGPGGKNLGCDTFTTDALDTNLWWVITAIIAFYFAYDMMARSRR